MQAPMPLGGSTSVEISDRFHAVKSVLYKRSQH